MKVEACTQDLLETLLSSKVVVNEPVTSEEEWLYCEDMCKVHESEHGDFSHSYMPGVQMNL